jgi:formate dehydrogenase subunit gamma
MNHISNPPAAPPPWSETTARRIVTAQAETAGPLLVALHALRAEFGAIDPRAVPILAEELNLTRADVHGVISFYRDFRRPAAAHQILICRAEACQSVGAERLAAHASDRLGIGFGETSPDGSVGLDEVFCLGNCALGPSVSVDGYVHGRVDASRFDAVLSLPSTR